MTRPDKLTWRQSAYDALPKDADDMLYEVAEGIADRLYRLAYGDVGYEPADTSQDENSTPSVRMGRIEQRPPVWIEDPEDRYR